jgi:hypothetical protein
MTYQDQRDRIKAPIIILGAPRSGTHAITRKRHRRLVEKSPSNSVRPACPYRALGRQGGDSR